MGTTRRLMSLAVVQRDEAKTSIQTSHLEKTFLLASLIGAILIFVSTLPTLKSMH
jgi:hypothetical protein